MALANCKPVALAGPLGLKNEPNGPVGQLSRQFTSLRSEWIEGSDRSLLILRSNIINISFSSHSNSMGLLLLWQYTLAQYDR